METFWFQLTYFVRGMAVKQLLLLCCLKFSTETHVDSEHLLSVSRLDYMKWRWAILPCTGELGDASTLWSLVIGCFVAVVFVVVGLGVACRSVRKSRSSVRLRQCSRHTSQTTLCTQLSVTGNSAAAASSGTPRSTCTTGLTADVSDSAYRSQSNTI